MASLDTRIVPDLVSRVDKLDAPLTGPGIKAQLDSILELGWNLIGIYQIGGNDFAVYTRPKRQT